MSTLPIICFRDGGPPLPDALNLTLKDSAISGRRPRKHRCYETVAMLLLTVLDISFFTFYFQFPIMITFCSPFYSGINGLDVEQCFPMQKNITMKLTNNQVLF